MSEHQQHRFTLTLSSGKRTNYTCSDLIYAMLPHEKRGSAQAHINTSIMMLHQVHFQHSRLTLREMLNDLTEKFDTTQSEVIGAAIVWHTAKHCVTSEQE